MVSPNWPSEDDPDYTPDFANGSGELDFGEPSRDDLEELREDIEDLVEE